MRISDLIKESHQVALKHGWWDDNRPTREAILMIIVELCEAIQKDRSGDNEGMAEELADVWIRLADLTAHLEIEIDDEIDRKMTINKGRERKHGKKY
jgi:NTP pyrophosphatase (non-canonical NTP hydrolase)